MRIFKTPNTAHGWKCPICKSNRISDVVLIPIHGTYDDGISEAEQVHFDCLDLVYDKENALIYQILSKEVKA